MLTNSGLWRIENQTRYNTEDLVAIFNAVEKHLVEVAGVQQLRATCTAVPGVIRFRDYSPASRSRTVSRWVEGGFERVEEVCYIRPATWGCSSERVVGLMVPSMLHSSPLEALASAVEGGAETAPVEFSKDVLRELVRFCYGDFGDSWQQVGKMEVGRVRVMRRRESRKVSMPVKALVLRDALSSVGGTLLEIQQVVQGLTCLEARHTIHATALESVGESIGFDKEDLIRLREHAQQVLDAVRDSYTKLTRAQT